MRKHLPKIIMFIYILYIFYLSVFTKNELFKVIYNTLDLWLYKIFPPIFIFYVISSLLISTKLIDLIIYILKPLRKIFKFETDNAFKLFFISILIGNPSSSSFIVSYYDNNLITKKDANTLICCASFISPLFIFSLVTFKQAIFIYISHLLSNFIISFILNRKNNIRTQKQKSNTLSFFIFLDKLPQILLMIAVYMVICNIIIFSIKNINQEKFTFLLSFIELSTGALNILAMDLNYKYYILLALISFNGLCIHLQIYSFIKNKLKYLLYLKYRIIQVLISLAILFLINTYFA